MKKVKILVLFLIFNISLQAQNDKKSIERDNVQIVYSESGQGDTTLLFVHGAFIDKAYWSAQVSFFKQHYRVIAIDLPGHGQSGKNRPIWSVQELGKDVCSLIDTLHLKNVVLIGHSMGGDIILEVANACPNSVIGFIGVDNFKNAGTAMPKEIQSQIAYILQMLKSDFANTSEAYAKQVLLTSSTDKSIADRVITDYRNMDNNIGVAIISDVFTYFERERELMSRLKLKMHLINVNYIPTNKDLLDKYATSGFDITIIDGTSHYPMIEKPNEFNKALENILIKLNH